MKNRSRKFLSVVLSGIMAISGMMQISASAAKGRLYNQFDSVWYNKTYYYRGAGGTLRSAGCGLFSLANAVYAVNGNKMNMDSLATWASKYGYWQPGGAGTYRDPFYSKVTAEFGGTYDFKITGAYYYDVTSNGLKTWLEQGNAAIAHVNNHFIALSGYDRKSGTFHVIESAETYGRSLCGYSWVTEYKLTRGQTDIDWFCLLQATQAEYFPQCGQDFESLIKALESVGAQSSFDYRGKIYVANGFTDTFRGLAEQNIAMLNLLKQGKLKKP